MLISFWKKGFSILKVHEEETDVEGIFRTQSIVCEYVNAIPSIHHDHIFQDDDETYKRKQNKLETICAWSSKIRLGQDIYLSFQSTLDSRKIQNNKLEMKLIEIQIL